MSAANGNACAWYASLSVEMELVICLRVTPSHVK